MLAQEARELADRRNRTRKETLRSEMEPLFEHIAHHADEHGEYACVIAGTILKSEYMEILEEDGYTVKAIDKRGEAYRVSF